MISGEVKLRKITYSYDSKGVYTESVEEKIVPLIRVQSIYANEFYKANEAGYRPTLRLRLSMLSYDDQQELIYMGQEYTVVRGEPDGDECVLVCQKKVKNVDTNS